MQGINRPGHVHLVNALLQLEKLMGTRPQECGCLAQTGSCRMELEELYRDYEKTLANLSVLIAEYETLFSAVKVQYLGRKLKELKKEISVEKPAFRMLSENIRLAYST